MHRDGLLYKLPASFGFSTLSLIEPLAQLSGTFVFPSLATLPSQSIELCFVAVILH